jgi:hypothetical protein
VRRLVGPLDFKRLKYYSLMFPRASNVVLSNIVSFSCERAPGMVGDVGGNCWAT